MLDRLRQGVSGIFRRPRNVTQTVLFADISGSTALYEERGDARARELIATRVDEMRTAIRREGGRVVKSLGDGILSVFPEPGRAVSAALGIAAESGDTTLDAKVGLHHGETIIVARDVFGDTVNTAARIADLAKAREVLMSRTVLEQLPGGYERLVRPVQPVVVKGKKEPLELFAALRFEDTGASETIPTGRNARLVLGGPRAVLLHWRGQEVRADGERPTVTLGRASDNDLAVVVESASRHHAVIELRGGKALLSDQSSNGTVIVASTGSHLKLHREQVPLIGSGTIYLGSGPADGVEGVRFELED
jgi:class 3 adenylate cyclase